MDSQFVDYMNNGDHSKVLVQVLTISNTLNLMPRLTTEDLSHTLTHAERMMMMEGDHHDEKPTVEEQVGSSSLVTYFT